MADSVMLRDLQRIVARAPIVVPEAASDLLARTSTPDAVFTQSFEAREFESVVRDHYLQRHPELARLIDPLSGLAASRVLLAQVEHGDEIASFVIDNATRTLLDTVHLDRAASRVDPTIEDVRRLLERSSSHLRSLALETLERFPADGVVRVSQQGALSTARTLWTKYDLARERGTEVLGLEGFVERLVALGPALIWFCPLPLPSGVLTIALDEHRDDVVGIVIARHDDGWTFRNPYQGTARRKTSTPCSIPEKMNWMRPRDDTIPDSEVVWLSSMEDSRFEAAFRCELESRIALQNDHHALLVTCNPPALGQDLGHPLGLDRLLLWSQFEGDDPWTFPAFPHFVQICLPEVPQPPDRMPPSIAWGELCATEADAQVQEMTERPHTPTPRNPAKRPDRKGGIG